MQTPTKLKQYCGLTQYCANSSSQVLPRARHQASGETLTCRVAVAVAAVVAARVPVLALALMLCRQYLKS